MTQRVLVIGASGFIGKRIIAALRKSGWAAPTCASRRGSSVEGCQGVRLDATATDQLLKALHGMDAVVNCMTGSAEAIITSARALFESAAKLAKAPRIVHLSSLAVYGSTTGVVDESSAFGADLDPYGGAQAAAEKLAQKYPNCVVLRPGIVYGPGSAWWSDRIARLLLARRLGDLGAAGEGICNLVHVNDVAAATVSALACSEAIGCAFNIANAAPPTWNDYFARYAAALGITTVPRISKSRLAFELNVLAYPYKVGEAVESKLRGLQLHPAPAIRPWLTRLCAHRITMNSERAEKILGLQWTPLDVGLRETASWFLSGSRC